MPAADLAPLEKRLPAAGTQVDADRLLELFLSYTEEVGLSMYAAQEEAVLELFAGHNVILNTPTGSGKSLVALAACFQALATDQVAFYVAPIKALVTEKFFELCKVLGAKNVGMMTGDASVNRRARVICCTAEILSNIALREGRDAAVDWVILDEFHYYSDRDRGVAWQIPLLTLPEARFLLMSATLGTVDFFLDELKRRTKTEAVLVRSVERPVPLDWEYSETPLQERILKLLESGKVPVYIVHFSQRAASEQAQNLMSLNFLSKEEKQRLRDELRGFRFSSPFGKELARFVPHGIGVHHAGMLPKYRRLVERLAQAGLLRVICGTDTLGVGVNVPIRTVLFTQLCKFDGENTVLLSVRDFHQIAGRAGRRGFDTQGSVVVQAPEHEIENKIQKDKAADNPKKLRKLRLKKPPERGYKAWNQNTLTQLREASPEPLVSSFKISHGMLLNVLAGAEGCKAAVRIVRDCHEPEARKRLLLSEGKELFRSLISSEILSVENGQVRVNTDLQQDFSMNQALSLYAVEAMGALDQQAPDYARVLLSVVESILENPWAILHRQVAWLKTQKLAELKTQGIEYEERMEELEKVEHKKPEAEFIYETFNLFAKHHPWVIAHNIAPKSIARDMHERAASFNDYVKEYGIGRAEGVLLRYLTDVLRALRQTVPEKYKTEEVFDLEEWLEAELLSVDASLLEEWEQLQLAEADPQKLVSSAGEKPPPDITRNQRAFSILIRNASWRLVRALARRDYARGLESLEEIAPPDAISVPGASGQVWTEARLEEAMSAYWQEHEEILADADARSARRVIIETTSPSWTVRQILSDPEEHHDWVLHFAVDLEESRSAQQLVMSLCAVSSGEL